MADKRTTIAEILFQADDRQYQRTANRLKKQSRKDSETIQKNLQRGLAVGLAGGFFVKMFADFEAGMSAVSKTSGLVGDDLQRLGERIRVMAQDSIFGTEALTSVAAATAQLGVQGAENIERYTAAVAELAAASDFNPDEAAFALARLSNIAGLGSDQVRNLASVFVDLGNQMPITESEIRDAGVSILAAGESFGFTADQALGAAAAFGSVGLASFANGTAVGNFLKQLGEATREGGSALEDFATVMGVSTEKVRHLFAEGEVAQALALFTGGLKGLGAEADVYLERVGILEARSQRLFKAAGEGVAEGLDIASKAFEEGTALGDEYKLMTDNLDSSMKILLNSLQVVGIEFGSRLAPSIRAVADATQGFVVQNKKPLGDTIELLGRLGLAFITLRLATAGASLASSQFLLTMGQFRKVANPFRGVGTAFKDFNKSVDKAKESLRGVGTTFVNVAKKGMSNLSVMRHGWHYFSQDIRNAGRVFTRTATRFRVFRRAYVAGVRVMRGFTLLLKTAWSAVWRAAFLFAPEIIRFLVKVFPDAIDVVAMKFEWMANAITVYFKYIQLAWQRYMQIYLSGVDKISETINKVFGTELPTAIGESWEKAADKTQKEVDNILWQQERLEGKMGESWGRIGDTAVGAFDEIVESGKEMLGIVSELEKVKVASPTRGDLYSTSGTDMGDQTPTPPGEMGPPAPVEEGGGAGSLETPNARRQSTMQGGPNAFNRITWEEHTNRVIAAAQAESEQERLAREEAAAEESERIARERGEALARIAAEQNARTRMEAEQLLADEQAAADREIELAEFKAETELEVHKMKLQGIEEEFITHYERMREIEAAIKEAKIAEDEAELLRQQQLRDQELAAHKKFLLDKVSEEMKSASKTLAVFGKSSKKLKKMSADMLLFEAITSASTKGPVDVARTYGQYSSLLPPPGGQILGGIAAAAVAAKYAAAIKEAHSATKMRTGGLVPGQFSLTDSQLAMLQPGEGVVPKKDFEHFVEAARSKARKEDGYGETGELDVNLTLTASQEISNFASVAVEASNVRKY